MKLVALFSLFILLISCSHQPVNNRMVAAFYEDVHFGDVDSQHSFVKKFPPEFEGDIQRFYFFVQLRDQQGDLIDRDATDFKITHNKTSMSFALKRVSRGKYYLIFEQPKSQKPMELDFWVAGKALSKQLKIAMKQASRAHSKLQVLKKRKNRVKFLLTLNDDQNKPVDVLSAPEIILDGNPNVQLESLERIAPGRWQVNVLFPDENLILYISVRSLSVYFKDLLRFQHVEK